MPFLWRVGQGKYLFTVQYIILQGELVEVVSVLVADSSMAASKNTAEYEKLIVQLRVPYAFPRAWICPRYLEFSSVARDKGEGVDVRKGAFVFTPSVYYHSIANNPSRMSISCLRNIAIVHRLLSHALVQLKTPYIIVIYNALFLTFASGKDDQTSVIVNHAMPITSIGTILRLYPFQRERLKVKDMQRIAAIRTLATASMNIKEVLNLNRSGTPSMEGAVIDCIWSYLEPVGSPIHNGILRKKVRSIHQSLIF